MTLHERHLKFSLEAAAILLVAALALPTQTDVDLWGHLRFGLDIIASKQVAVADTYSFTSDRPWINHEWLSEVLMAASYTTAGSRGLVALKLSLLAIFTMTTWLALRLRGATPLWRTVGVVVTLVASFPLFHTIRPQLWSLACCSTLLLLQCARDRRWLVAAPFLFVLWVNAHGGWLIGLMVLVVWLGSETIRGRMRLFVAALTVAACMSATLANPHGYRLLAFLGETVRTTRDDITEWAPVLESTPYLAIWVLCALALIHAAIRRQGLRLLAPVVLAYLSWKVQRVTPFFALVTMVTLLPVRGVSTQAHVAFRGGDRLAAGVICAVVLAVALVGFGAAATASLPCIAFASDGPDRAAADSIERLQLRGRIVTWFDWGEYVIWRFGPGLQVSMDGRRETVYSAATLRRHEQFFKSGFAGWPELETLRPDYVWLPRSLPSASLIAGEGWTPVISTPRSIVWARHAGPNTPVVISASSNRGCFSE